MEKKLCSRVSSSLYNEIKEFIINICVNHKIIIVKNMPDKEDYGDMDIICEEVPLELFDTKYISRNSNITSIAIEYKNIYFQIDFIVCSTSIEMCEFYYNYGDISLIFINLLFSGIGLTFSYKGLYCYLFDETINGLTTCPDKSKINKSKNRMIILSDSPREICEYINLDFDVYCKGFNNNEDIIKWLKKSDFILKYQSKCNYIKKLADKKLFSMYNDSINEKNKFVNLQLDAIKHFNKVDDIHRIKESMKKDSERSKDRKEIINYIKSKLETNMEIKNCVMNIKEQFGELTMDNAIKYLKDSK